MCGLVGIAGDLTHSDEGTMRRLLLLDYLRGTDSTGIAAIGRDYDWGIAKIASHPIDLFDMARFKSLLSATKMSAFIGHNRAATRGAVNAQNAHPYEYKHIVGAHNGTLDKDSWERLEEAVGEKFETDSAAIFAAIAVIGVDAAIALMEEGKNASEGAWALVWYDGKENTINFLKNKHRPLWTASSLDGDKIFWSSEWEMLDYSAGTALTKYQFHFDGDHCFFPLPDDTLHSWDLETLIKANSGPVEPVTREIKGRAPVSKVVNDPFGRDVDGWTDDYSGMMGFQPPYHTGSSTSSTTNSRSNSELVSCLQIDGDGTSPFAGFVSRPDFEQYARGGCAWCKGEVKWGEVGVTVFEKQSKIMCNDCSPGMATRIYIQNSVFRNLI